MSIQTSENKWETKRNDPSLTGADQRTTYTKKYAAYFELAELAVTVSEQGSKESQKLAYSHASSAASRSAPTSYTVGPRGAQISQVVEADNLDEKISSLKSKVESSTYSSYVAQQKQKAKQKYDQATAKLKPTDTIGLLFASIEQTNSTVNLSYSSIGFNRATAKKTDSGNPSGGGSGNSGSPIQGSAVS